MATVFLVLVVVLVVAALVFGVISLLSGDDPGLSTSDPDGRARPLPNNRSLAESDLKDVRFDVGLRGYRMAQVDRVLRRTAYDLGYKDEMIAVLEAEVAALREGRTEDAELLRKARESAASPVPTAEAQSSPAAAAAVSSWMPDVEPGESDFAKDSDAPSSARPDSDPAEAADEVGEAGGDPHAYDPTAPGRLAPIRTAANTDADVDDAAVAAEEPETDESDSDEPRGDQAQVDEPRAAEEPAERRARA